MRSKRRDVYKRQVVTSAADYYNSRHSRTCVGITAEGKVVMMVLDGRQAVSYTHLDVYKRQV